MLMTERTIFCFAGRESNTEKDSKRDEHCALTSSLKIINETVLAWPADPCLIDGIPSVQKLQRTCRESVCFGVPERQNDNN